MDGKEGVWWGGSSGRDGLIACGSNWGAKWVNITTIKLAI